jgi:hypothetical protein
VGVLQDFERRLEGAVEGVFARIFRSGLQPIEMAKGLQRYARDTQHVSHDGVVVPNAYRFTVSSKDHERFERLGIDLPRELADVVTGTARERDWLLRGPAIVRVAAGKVPVGRYDLVGRVEAVEPEPAPGPTAEPPADEQRAAAASVAAGAVESTAVLDAPGEAPPPPPRPRTATVRVVGGGSPRTIVLDGRTVAGRADSADVTLHDSTVSREHAAFVRRSSGWWVVDLGSMNGTKVNGRAAGEHELGDGDTIELGEAVLEFLEG